jgi:hypothetical protein
VQCDEKKPVCRRCILGERECEYPQSVYNISNLLHPTDPPSPSGSSSHNSDDDSSIEETDSNPEECKPKRPTTHAFLPFNSGTNIRIHEDVANIHQPEDMLVISIIARPLRVTEEAKLWDFLGYHSTFICPGHYFYYADFDHFCDRGLLELTEYSSTLRYAVAAYSALLFSVYGHSREARVLAYTYYSQALHSVNKTIMTSPTEDYSVFGVLAAVLQLTTFEVRRRFKNCLILAFPRRPR